MKGGVGRIQFLREADRLPHFRFRLARVAKEKEAERLDSEAFGQGDAGPLLIERDPLLRESRIRGLAVSTPKWMSRHPARFINRSIGSSTRSVRVWQHQRTERFFGQKPLAQPADQIRAAVNSRSMK